jgi:hypothetical protein
VSNAQGRTSGSFSLKEYRDKAKKTADKAGPFVLDVDTDTSITIPRPTANQMFDAEAAIQRGDSRSMIVAICGDLADDVLEVLGDEDFKVMAAFGEDLTKHFEIGQ